MRVFLRMPLPFTSLIALSLAFICGDIRLFALAIIICAPMCARAAANKNGALFCVDCAASVGKQRREEESDSIIAIAVALGRECDDGLVFVVPFLLHNIFYSKHPRARERAHSQLKPCETFDCFPGLRVQPTIYAAHMHNQPCATREYE